MKFQIEFTDVAEMEAQDTLLWLLGRSPDFAGRWQAGLEKAIQSLEVFPTRCARAPESDSFDVDVRQLIYSGYRILFTCLDADGDGADDTIRILHVRHGSRRPLDEVGGET